MVERARERYRHRCGYCGVHEEDAGSVLTVDHFRPRAHGDGNEDANIVYCCACCNTHKGAYWHEADPPHIPLLNPLRSDLSAHLREEESGQVVGLTPEGAFLVARLRLNRQPLVAYRRHRRADQTRESELKALRATVLGLQEQIASLAAPLQDLVDQISRETG